MPSMSLNCSNPRLPPIAAVPCINTAARLIVLAAVASAGFAQALDTTPFYASTFEKLPAASALTALGRQLFFDPALSGSGKISCASCHDPRYAFGPPNDLPVQRAGVRAVPSLKYMQNVPPFTEHFTDDEGDNGADQGPAGGRTWDGRSQSLHDQARLPLFSPLEMANKDMDAVVASVQVAHGLEFRAVFGAKVFEDKSAAFKGVLMALEAYQQNPAEFYPYSSKFDAFLRHETALSAQELRGLTAFNDPEAGNCARCHPSAVKNGALPQFTDFGFAALGAPRNKKIPANADEQYYDLGLCGPLRLDLKDRREYCGLFRTPSLRNVALRQVFFHNGVFHSLTDVVRFYAQRDTQPQKWYPRAADGGVLKFDDLPAGYLANVDTQTPLDRHVGDPSALSETDIQDIVAFLRTLTDDYEQGSPRAQTPRRIQSGSGSGSMQ
jgi:cytochrome c peroxidase